MVSNELKLRDALGWVPVGTLFPESTGMFGSNGVSGLVSSWIWVILDSNDN